jgi:hypothetical protein
VRIILYVNFRELDTGEVHRILLLGTSVNRGVLCDGKGVSSTRIALPSIAGFDNDGYIESLINRAATR